LYDDQLNTVARVATNGAFSNDEQLTAWSPDGQRLAFLQREGDGGHHLWLTDRKAVDFERLTTVPRFATGVSWSPDGTRLALTGAAGEIWLLDLEDGSERLLADQVYPGISPAWSPDGRYMLYTTTMNADSYYKTLVLLDLAAPDTEPERLSAVAHSWAELVWLADRDRVVYQTSPATINMLDPIADDGYPWLTVRGQVHEVAASTDGRVAVHILERQTGPHIVISGMTHRVMPSKREQITALCWR
jgi:Tol biopolymer transport system component